MQRYPVREMKMTRLDILGSVRNDWPQPALMEKLSLTLANTVALLIILCLSPLKAQSPDVPDWQTAAGGKLAFEVASVKPDSGPFRPPKFPLDNGNAYTPSLLQQTFAIAQNRHAPSGLVRETRRCFARRKYRDQFATGFYTPAHPVA